MVHGGSDPIVGVSQAKVIAKDTHADLQIVEGEDHSFGEGSVKIITEWLERKLKWLIVYSAK